MIRLKTILITSFVGYLMACASIPQPPRDFLQVDNPALERWLNETVDVHADNVSINFFFPSTPAFSDANIWVDMQEKISVTYHVDRVSRRYVLWQIAQKYGLAMRFDHLFGRPSFIIVSKK